MRISVVILGLALILLQGRLWLSERGMQEVTHLQAAIDAQAGANREQRERNRQLAAEVNNLKVGLTALEERARSELGMVGRSETFFQVVKGRPTATLPVMPLPPAAPIAQPLTARAQ
jgi:cell division protein FtsB